MTVEWGCGFLATRGLLEVLQAPCAFSVFFGRFFFWVKFANNFTVFVLSMVFWESMYINHNRFKWQIFCRIQMGSFIDFKIYLAFLTLHYVGFSLTLLLGVSYFTL